jgi:hypothetical protein
MPRADRQSREARSCEVDTLRSTQLSLLEPNGIDGLEYRPDLVSPELECELVERFSELDFKEFEFRGYLGGRRVDSFGVRYDFSDSKAHQAPAIPGFRCPAVSFQ